MAEHHLTERHQINWTNVISKYQAERSKSDLNQYLSFNIRTDTIWRTNAYDHYFNTADVLRFKPDYTELSRTLQLPIYQRTLKIETYAYQFNNERSKPIVRMF
ncbi:hypothetical protein VIGAN_07158400 [Vigna angularis var. angularis]|uniref:Uncharacterized protein n=1 Tax=Vigna angularis var. angularis TaxID=157739 RepID=A0A0S3SIT0_PHAAN|nr:hypothetical protein VIGAN_07158400 [Vigna angularis var. angularis]